MLLSQQDAAAWFGPFKSFEKIPRLKRGCVITEKIDGTNASIHISESGDSVAVASRNRYITPTDDNFGFAKWVEANLAEIVKLGPGSHFGEWWGPGIQRGYGLAEKKFSLFNTGRWASRLDELPACVSVVPILYQGEFSDEAVNRALIDLRVDGSKASPGFMRPEGIVIYHTAARSLYKVTLENDAEVKKGPRNDHDLPPRGKDYLPQSVTG